MVSVAWFSLFLFYFVLFYILKPFANMKNNLSSQAIQNQATKWICLEDYSLQTPVKKKKKEKWYYSFSFIITSILSNKEKSIASLSLQIDYVYFIKEYMHTYISLHLLSLLYLNLGWMLFLKCLFYRIRSLNNFLFKVIYFGLN